MADPDLKGQVAIVTGAGRGIGAAIARRLADAGATLVVCDLTEDAAEGARAATGDESRTMAFHGNLADDDVAGRLVEQVIARFGKIDILVNNAGGGILRPFLEHTPATLRETIDRNLYTTIWCTWHALPHMKAARYGRVINIGADSVRNGLQWHAGYNAAKGGVHGMMTGLAREFARDGITVNTIAPCAVQTKQLEEVLAEQPELEGPFISIIPIGRPAAESEVAGMVAYLAGPDAAFITGQVISVNGGTNMH